jgi:hypothetical protein
MSLKPLTINQAHGWRTANAGNPARLVVQGDEQMKEKWDALKAALNFSFSTVALL